MVHYGKTQKAQDDTYPVQRTHSKSAASTNDGGAGTTKALISSFMASATSTHSAIALTAISTTLARLPALSCADPPGREGEEGGGGAERLCEGEPPLVTPEEEEEEERVCFSAANMFLSNNCIS